MYKALKALRGTTGHHEEPVSHDRAMEHMRDNYLTDNCSVKEFTDKVRAPVEWARQWRRQEAANA